MKMSVGAGRCELESYHNQLTIFKHLQAMEIYYKLSKSSVNLNFSNCGQEKHCKGSWIKKVIYHSSDENKICSSFKLNLVTPITGLGQVLGLIRAHQRYGLHKEEEQNMVNWWNYNC